MSDPERWLLLIHQLPPEPAYLRVKVSRRLQRVGALLLKNSIYVLPDRAECREHFAWIQREITAERGEASICEAGFVAGLTDEQLVLHFRAAREQDYLDLLEEARGLLEQPWPQEQHPRLRRELTRLRKRQAEVLALDHFNAPGANALHSALTQLDNSLQEPVLAELSAVGQADFPIGGEWVTREDIHVDRIASAWLIRRFLDPQARFLFVAPDGFHPQPRQLRFDMFQAEYTHVGDACTFEVLLQRSRLKDPALRAIAEIVHDLDLKDGKYGRPETDGVARLLAGLEQRHALDADRLEAGCHLLDDLYASY